MQQIQSDRILNFLQRDLLKNICFFQIILIFIMGRISHPLDFGSERWRRIDLSFISSDGCHQMLQKVSENFAFGAEVMKFCLKFKNEGIWFIMKRRGGGFWNLLKNNLSIRNLYLLVENLLGICLIFLIACASWRRNFLLYQHAYDFFTKHV